MNNKFKKEIKSILNHTLYENEETPSFIKEKLDVNVNQLAGALIAAGPQKTADAISKMDPNTFAEFAKRIDGDGIKMITQQFATDTETATQPQSQQPSEVPGNRPQQVKPEVNPSKLAGI